MENSNQPKKTKMPESNLEKVVGGVKTTWAACDKYKPVGGDRDRTKMCGCCIYCDKYVEKGFVLGPEDANCHYPDPVNLIEYCNSID